MITWTRSESCEHPDARSAYHEGYFADVYPTGFGNWFWRVDTTNRISEYPEVCDCGEASTASSACTAAENYLRSYP